MTQDEIISMAREAGGLVYGARTVIDVMFTPETIERFAALVATAERRKHQADIEKWKTEAATAEKWRGLALSKDGDGRCVQLIQQEAAAKEREACAQIADAQTGNTMLLTSFPPKSAAAFQIAAEIRARGQQ